MPAAPPTNDAAEIKTGTKIRKRTAELALPEARRIALAAQGFNDRRPVGTPDMRSLRRVLGRIGLLQIDSVNVLVRAHYLPLYSRLGPYPVALLDRASNKAPIELFEYWAHVASLVPVGTQPFLRWRMDQAYEAWGSIRSIKAERPDVLKRVLVEVADRGPLTAGEIEHDVPRPTGNWGWNWNEVKRALEYLFYSGDLVCAGRRGFERLYDLPERVLPAEVLATPTPEPAEAHRELVRIAAHAYGVATVTDLRDYFRLSVADTKVAVDSLVEAGDLEPVRVEGWDKPAYLASTAKIPRAVQARALVSPFDSLVFERARTEALFGFYYRIEIYVPKPKRVFGYYVLPFLLGDQLVARVDLKADRQAGVLRVQASHAEAGAPPETAAELAAELRQMADWLGLGDVVVVDAGDLARALAAEVASAG